MDCIVFTSQDEAEAWAAKVAAAEGYPKPGVDIGGGRHVPPELSVTVAHVAVEKHPTKDEWMCPVDAIAAKELEAGEVKTTLSKAQLDEWRPATGPMLAVAEVEAEAAVKK